MKREPYRVLVTGSRDWKDHDLVRDALARARYEAGGPMVVVHGACPSGADAIAAWWCRRYRHLDIMWEEHPADWDVCTGPACTPAHRVTRRDGTTYCPTAGHDRNQRMVDLGAAVCLAFLLPCAKPTCRRRPKPHGSHGTADAIERATKAGIPVRRWPTPTPTAQQLTLGED